MAGSVKPTRKVAARTRTRAFMVSNFYSLAGSWTKGVKAETNPGERRHGHRQEGDVRIGIEDQRRSRRLPMR